MSFCASAQLTERSTNLVSTESMSSGMLPSPKRSASPVALSRTNTKRICSKFSIDSIVGTDTSKPTDDTPSKPAVLASNNTSPACSPPTPEIALAASSHWPKTATTHALTHPLPLAGSWPAIPGHEALVTNIMQYLSAPNWPRDVFRFQNHPYMHNLQEPLQAAAAGAPFLYGAFRKPKRIRTAFTPHQLMALEKAFDKNHYVVGAERRELAAKLDLSETQVKVWFQNRRTKHKRVRTEDGNSGGLSMDGGSSSGSGVRKSERSNTSTPENEIGDETTPSFPSQPVVTSPDMNLLNFNIMTNLMAMSQQIGHAAVSS